jgi:hypothetical protein
MGYKNVSCNQSDSQSSLSHHWHCTLTSISDKLLRNYKASIHRFKKESFKHFLVGWIL